VKKMPPACLAVAALLANVGTAALLAHAGEYGLARAAAYIAAGWGVVLVLLLRRGTG
jgi:hypothetical protein